MFFQRIEIGSSIDAVNRFVIIVPRCQIIIKSHSSWCRCFVPRFEWLIWVVIFIFAANVPWLIPFLKRIRQSVLSQIILLGCSSSDRLLAFRRRAIQFPILVLICIMPVEFLIDIRPLHISRVSLNKLMLYFIESHLSLSELFFSIVVDVVDLHSQRILKDAIEVQLIGKFDVEVDVTIAV